jgi:hypothetical protein
LEQRTTVVIFPPKRGGFVPVFLGKMMPKIYIIPTTIGKTMSYRSVLTSTETLSNEYFLANHLDSAVKLEAILHTNFHVAYGALLHINLDDKFIWDDPELESMLLRIVVTGESDFTSQLMVDCYRPGYNAMVQEEIIEDKLANILTPTGVEKALKLDIYWEYYYSAEESPLYKIICGCFAKAIAELSNGAIFVECDNGDEIASPPAFLLL